MNDTPTIPARLRTVLYVVGTFSGLAIAPALAASSLPPIWTALAAGVAGACNALAFGYRPTRTDATGDA